MSSSLTTRFLFKQQAGITGTTDDTLIDRLIGDVSEAIERRCDRVFGTATYRQWLDGSGTRQMLLPQYPVTDVHMISDYLDDVLEVYFTGGVRASVGYDGTNLRLHSVSTAGAETSTSAATATYKTVQTLATQIATISGWTATVLNSLGTRPSTLIRPCFAQDALDPTTATLSVATDSDEILISVMSQRAIENRYEYSFPCGRQNIFCWYVAGYTLPVDNDGHTALTTAGDLPGGLIAAVNAVLNDVYLSRKRDRTLQSESLGDYSYSNASGPAGGLAASAIEAHWRELSPYARKMS